MHRYPACLFFAFLLTFNFLSQNRAVAQQNDSLRADTVLVAEPEQKHSPTLASLMSMAVPGLGQAYNKKYWKIPIIYGGIGLCMYYALEQNSKFEDKRSAYRNRLAGDSTDQFLVTGNFYSNESLLKSMDINRRNRDLMIIISLGVYIIQIADASVDAHLFYFNVSDDLSVRYTPYFRYAAGGRPPESGLSLTLTF